MTGELAFLWALALILVLRATWLSARKQRHLGWISAAGGPLILAGAVLDRDLLFLPGIILMIVGEFLHQMNDEVPPKDRNELR